MVGTMEKDKQDVGWLEILERSYRSVAANGIPQADTSCSMKHMENGWCARGKQVEQSPHEIIFKTISQKLLVHADIIYLANL